MSEIPWATEKRFPHSRICSTTAPTTPREDKTEDQDKKNSCTAELVDLNFIFAVLVTHPR